MEFFHFLRDHFPSYRDILVLGPLFLSWNLLSLTLAGLLKRKAGAPTGYSRKLFHFLTFTSAVVIQYQWGLDRLFLFGASTTLVLSWAILQGRGHLCYEALAREKDEPRRTLFIILPYLATLTGGLTANICFGPAALVGYMVAGVGDAVGELVGTQLGRHRYRVPTMHGQSSWRSFEGSIAVWIFSIIVLIICWHVGWNLAISSSLILKAIAIGFCCALLEAWSPHGWDNFTMQVIPSALTAWFII